MHRPITVPSRTSRAANKAWCRGAYRHGCASSADPASSATGPACERGPGSETSHRRRAPRPEPVDRRRARPPGPPSNRFDGNPPRNLAAKAGAVKSLNCRTRYGCRPCPRQIRCTDETLMDAAWAMAVAVQCVVSPGGSPCVRATTRTATSGPSGGMLAGRVLSRRSQRGLLARSAPASARPRFWTTPASRRIHVRPEPIGAQQHDLSTPDMLLRRIPVSHEGFEPKAIRGGSVQERLLRIPPDSQDTTQTGTRDGLNRQVSIMRKQRSSLPISLNDSGQARNRRGRRARPGERRESIPAPTEGWPVAFSRKLGASKPCIRWHRAGFHFGIMIFLL